MKGKCMDTKFEKPSVVRQRNAFKFQKPLILGKPSPFSNSLKKKDLSKSRKVPKTNLKHDLSKPVTSHISPKNEKEKQVQRNTNVIAPGMTKKPIAVPISTREPKRTVNQSVAISHKRTIASESTI
ncbi:hypothetical protein Tco_1295672 [Tanacetum coccineum]